MNKKIIVFGSFVADLMARTPHLPSPGETVKGSSFTIGPGGKGFNQAVAAYKAGADVTIVTKLGRDPFADLALETLDTLGLDTSHILRTDTSKTGAALICVDENSGQNEIVVVPGACAEITAEEVEALRSLFSHGDILLIQLETNPDAIWQAIRMAKEEEMSVILNPAPVQAIPEEILPLIDVVTPNEVEAEALVGFPIQCVDDAARAACSLLARGVSAVVITLGARGAYIHDGNSGAYLPARKVPAIDTTGAGDAFTGGLAAALAEGASLGEAAVFATALASISVQRLGATPAMPTRAEIDALLDVTTD